MASYSPITLKIVDNSGTVKFHHDVPFEFELDVEEVMERAFVLAQTLPPPPPPAPPLPIEKRDPLPYTLKYYGYSESPQFPGYLGYEVESIFDLVTDTQNYWELKLDGILSPTGADSTHPGPGSTVLWTYVKVPVNPTSLPGRTQVIQQRRSSRRRRANSLSHRHSQSKPRAAIKIDAPANRTQKNPVPRGGEAQGQYSNSSCGSDQ